MNVYKKITALSLLVVSSLSMIAHQVDDVTKTINYQNEAITAALISGAVGAGTGGGSSSGAVSSNSQELVTLASINSSNGSTKTVTFSSDVTVDGSNNLMVATAETTTSSALDTDPSVINVIGTTTNVEAASNLTVNVGQGSNIIDGNMHVLNSNVTIDSPMRVNGDLIILNGNLTVGATGSLEVFGNICVSGSIFGDLSFTTVAVVANGPINAQKFKLLYGSLTTAAGADIFIPGDMILDARELPGLGLTTLDSLFAKNITINGFTDPISLQATVRADQDIIFTNNNATTITIDVGSTGQFIAERGSIVFDNNDDITIEADSDLQACKVWMSDSNGVITIDPAANLIAPEIIFYGALDVTELVTTNNIIGNLLVQGNLLLDTEAFAVQGDITVFGEVLIQNGSLLTATGDIWFDGAAVSAVSVGIPRMIIDASSVVGRSLRISNYAGMGSGPPVLIQNAGTDILTQGDIIIENNTSSGGAFNSTVRVFSGPLTIASMSGDIIFRNNLEGGSGADAVNISLADDTEVSARNIVFVNNGTTSSGESGVKISHSGASSGRLNAKYDLAFILNQGAGAGFGVDIDDMDIRAQNLVVETDCGAGVQSVDIDGGSLADYFSGGALTVLENDISGSCTNDVTP